MAERGTSARQSNLRTASSAAATGLRHRFPKSAKSISGTSTLGILDSNLDGDRGDVNPGLNGLEGLLGALDVGEDGDGLGEDGGDGLAGGE